MRILFITRQKFAYWIQKVFVSAESGWNFLFYLQEKNNVFFFFLMSFPVTRV